MKDLGPRGVRRKWEKEIERMLARLELTRVDGAGFPIDQTLREFHSDANDRFLAKGEDNLPASFLIVDRFCKKATEPDWYPLRDERDHLFSLMDFLMFSTSDAAPSNLVEAAALLPEGVIHNYTPIGDWAEECTFREEDGTQMALCGVSLVRTGREVAVIAVGGPVVDLARKTEEIRDFYHDKLGNMQALHGTDAPLPVIDGYRAEPVPGTDRVWKHVAMAIINPAERATRGRYLFIDEGRTRRIHSDDPGLVPGALEQLEALGEDPDREALPPALKWSLDVLEQNRVFFNLAVHSLLLPAYFAYRRTQIREEKVETGLFRKRSERETRRRMDEAGPVGRVLVRRVAALRIEKPGLGLPGREVGSRAYTPPAFSVEVGGFWRRLKIADNFGHGPDGEEVQGWTWVKSHQRWRDRPAAPKTVAFKTPLNAAERR